VNERSISAHVAVLCGVFAVVATGPIAFGGTVRHVYNWSQLWSAVVSRAPGDEIIVHPGVYNVSNSLYMSGCEGLILRGSTGNPEDVILRGPGMNNPNGSTYEGFQFASPNMTLADVTIEEFYHHGIHFQSAADGCTVDNVIVRNCGEQYMKGAKFNDDLIIRNSLMVQTKERLNGLPNRPDNYTGGIDLHGARNFHIHDNVAIDIVPGDAGIFLWNETSNGVIERNIVTGCNKGIALGNPSNSNVVVHARDVIIRNNFITRGPDIGIELCYVKDIRVYNNTVYGESGSYFRSIHLLDDYRGIYIPMENVDLAYNIVRGNILDNTRAGGYTLTGNIIGSTAQPSWFVDPAAGDLHLTKFAGAAIDAAGLLADVPADIDGHPRPLGTASDVGADEFVQGDCDGDQDVDVFDAIAIVNAFGSQPGDPNWDEGCDLDADNVVDVFDVILVVNNFGAP